MDRAIRPLRRAVGTPLTGVAIALAVAAAPAPSLSSASTASALPLSAQLGLRGVLPAPEAGPRPHLSLRGANPGVAPRLAPRLASTAAGLRGPQSTPAVGPRPYASLQAPAPAIRSAAPTAMAEPSPRAAPSLFGSVALPIRRTPSDARWRAVRRAGAVVPAAWSGLPARLAGLPIEARAQAVNSWVNSRVAVADDRAIYGVADHWASLSETVSRGRGDCEDFAIAKMQLLRAAGVPARDLYLVIARDLVRRQDHAVLAVRLGARFVVLDNGVDRLLPGETMQDYRPILTYSEDRAWTHGYRRAAAATYAATRAGGGFGAGAGLSR